MSIPSPAIITAAVIRSILQALGMEQVLTDFAVVTAIGTLAVLSAIVMVGVRSSHSIPPNQTERFDNDLTAAAESNPHL